MSMEASPVDPPTKLELVTTAVYFPAASYRVLHGRAVTCVPSPKSQW